jgi:FkbM family methyltransferase
VITASIIKAIGRFVPRRVGAELRRLWFGRIRNCTIDSVQMLIIDRASSVVTGGIIGEYQADQYRLGEVPIEPGDVIIDIGTHVGVGSIFLAKKYPQTQIYSFEPLPINFASLLENIRLNGVTNVHPINKAVTADGRPIDLAVDLLMNTGAATTQLEDRHLPGYLTVTVPSTTLDAIFEEHSIARCRLLKIDCEGSEHEILRTATVLDRIDYLRGEFHENDFLRQQGYTADSLVERCAQFIPRENIYYVFWEMETGTAAAGSHSRFDLGV